MNAMLRSFFAAISCTALLLGSAFAAPADPAGQSLNSTPAAASTNVANMFGIGVKASLLGVGAEVATRVTHHSNVRAGFNILGYSRGFSKDGIDYNGHLSFRTVEAHYDYFPWARSFHLGPGVLYYIGNPVTANALVPSNQSFTLGSQTYYSDPSAPVSAGGRVNFNQVSPMATFGWGNLVRENRRFSIPVEFGVAFQGSPKTTLNLSGSVCTSPGLNCTSTASSSVQTNVVAEQGRINKSMSPFKAYPIISVGFGYKF